MKSKFAFAVALLVAALGYVGTSAKPPKADGDAILPPLDLQYIGKSPNLKGHPLIIEQWATWCGPCRASIAHLNEVYDKYHSQGLEIVGITKEDPETVKTFLKTVPIKYQVALATKMPHLPRTTTGHGIPHAWLVDKSGKIVLDGGPGKITDNDIEALLK